MGKDKESRVQKIARNWHDFWNKKITIAVPLTPIGVIPTASQAAPAEYEDTVGGAAGKVTAAVTAPALITGAITAGVPATLVGLGVGAAGSAAGSALGQGVTKALGGDEYTQEMFSDLGGVAGGLVGGAGGIKGLLLMKPKVRNYRVAKAVSNELNKEIATTELPVVLQLSNMSAEPVLLLRQPTGNTSYAFFERPSKLSFKERAGIPKGERNNIELHPAYEFDRSKIRVKNESGELVPLEQSPHAPWQWQTVAPGEIYYVEGVPYKNGIKGLYILLEDPFGGRPLVLRLERRSYMPKEEAVLFADPPENLKDISKVLTNYAKNLPEVTDQSAFIDTDFINYFLNYYRNLGYDISKVDPVDLLKIIQDSYTLLSASSNGALKGRVFWNGSPNRYFWDGKKLNLVKEGFPETFEKIPNLSAAAQTSASDAAGVYFGTQPFVSYGLPSAKSSSGMYVGGIGDPGITGLDMQPYILNGVERIYNRSLPEGLRGWIPKNSVIYTNTFKGNHATGYINGFTDEIAVGFGTKMKSLFPHPKAFVVNPDGTVTLNRTWENAGLHYKHGGKMNYLDYFDKGGGI